MTAHIARHNRLAFALPEIKLFQVRTQARNIESKKYISISSPCIFCAPVAMAPHQNLASRRGKFGRGSSRQRIQDCSRARIGSLPTHTNYYHINKYCRLQIGGYSSSLQVANLTRKDSFNSFNVYKLYIIKNQYILSSDYLFREGDLAP